MDGAVLIDKPAGMTSAAVVGRVKRRFSLKRVGHAGTLDPMATGLLVLLSGKATRLQSIFLESSKSYSGEIRLGVATDTDDVSGEVLARDEQLEFAHNRDLAELARELEKEFSGEQFQRPPSVSALHVNGRRSYELARSGDYVELPKRKVYIERLELEFKSKELLSYRVRCSKGTYVRSLARDIGDFLGSCGSLSSIRRLESAPFSVENAVLLETLLESEDFGSHLIPIEALVERVPRLSLPERACEQLRYGDQRILQGFVEDIESGASGFTAVFSPAGKFQALLEKVDENWRIRFTV